MIETKEMFIKTFGEFKNNNRLTLATYNKVLQDLERTEQLEKENQKLKERYKHRAETSKELNEALTQHQKAIEILKDKLEIVLTSTIVGPCITSWKKTINNKNHLTQQEYELLKEVLE